MDDPLRSEPLPAEEDAYEVVDALPVIGDHHPAEPTLALREPGAVVGLVQTAAVAATGFVAGVATAAVLGRRRQRRRGQLQPNRQGQLGRTGQLGPARAAQIGPVREGQLGPARQHPRPPATGSLEVVSSRRYLVDVYVLERRA